MRRVAVIGAGSWGTAVAAVLGGKGTGVMLWARDRAVAESVNAHHSNPRYLSSVALPRSVVATDNLEEALRAAELVVMATPSRATRTIAESMKPHLPHAVPVVSLTKGLEGGSLLRMTEVLFDVFGGRSPLAVLSGPNHAEEVSAGIPSAAVVAAYDDRVGGALRSAFMTRAFRVYTNRDVIGVELAAASKNVIAIAAGISDGMGFGDNTKAALMTRGLAEMSRLGRSAGANPLTFMGLAGMGDLIATCTSRHSRNRALGEQIAQGGSVEEFERQTRMVAEGAASSVTIDQFAAELGVEMPITRQVRAILQNQAPLVDAVDALMGRDATDELHGIHMLDG